MLSVTIPAHVNSIVLFFYRLAEYRVDPFVTYNTFSSLARLIGGGGGARLRLLLLGLWPSLPVSEFSGNVPLLSAAT